MNELLRKNAERKAFWRSTEAKIFNGTSREDFLAQQKISARLTEISQFGHIFILRHKHTDQPFFYDQIIGRILLFTLFWNVGKFYNISMLLKLIRSWKMLRKSRKKVKNKTSDWNLQAENHFNNFFCKIFLSILIL